ncbi:MAG: CAP domain-containing protein [Chloroflexi bacterium]|nr:CAP domain-containing protein [Chloroflexota bacterium]
MGLIKALAIFLLVMLGALTGFHMLQGLEFQTALARDVQDGRALYEWGVCGFEVVFMPNNARAVYEGFREDEIGKTLLPQPIRTWDPKECPDILGAVESLVGAPAPSAPSVGASPVPENRPTATAYINTPTPVKFATPTTTARGPSVASPTPTLAPTPTATTSRQSVLSESDARDLRQLALSLINNDRAKFGLPPVTLGSNQAAQLHADDMLEHQYLGHWWVDGRKPYMVYTQTGGTSYVAENAAISGWTDSEWAIESCDSPRVACQISPVAESVADHQWGMMYDDADSNWGHRDNILGVTHKQVNIGIAFNGRLTTFVQHFEGGAVEAPAPPSLDSSGKTSIRLNKVLPGISVGGVVSVYFDPLPTRKTPHSIDLLHSYCTGGGFTTDCPTEPVARILKPPGAGFFYSDLDSKTVIADSWFDSPSQFNMTAALGQLATLPGVYTFVVWRDTGTGVFTEQLMELSAFQP